MSVTCDALPSTESPRQSSTARWSSSRDCAENTGNGIRIVFFRAVIFLCCDVIVVPVLILALCQAFSILYTFPSANINCYIVQNSKHQKQNSTNCQTHTHTHTHTREPTKTKEEKHGIQDRRIPYVTTISKHQPSANRHTTVVYIILGSLSLESQQQISSVKLLCCHHSNCFLSRALDLCSSLIREYCPHKKAHTIHFSLTCNYLDMH